ncbi:Intraflagellar transport-like protein 43B [Lamellibrachia satsuma]|nr:Intraflagellar transport-like protein 43B [Lamellibrachia satsuma]
MPFDRIRSKYHGEQPMPLQGRVWTPRQYVIPCMKSTSRVEETRMDDDFAFGDKNGRDKSAKKGRRAHNAPDVAAVPVDDTVAEEVMAHETKSGDVPRPKKRVGGWGEEKRRRKRNTDEIEDERLRQHSPEQEDSDSDIPVIPDLEDQQDDLTTQIAVAPNVAVNRVATYRELDNDLLQHASFLTLDSLIDLKLLSKGLSSEADVKEEEKVWDWDRLFTEVTSELLMEWEKKEEVEQKGGA